MTTKTTVPLDLDVLAESIESQLRWILLRYEVRALETFTVEQIAAALPTSQGPNHLTFRDSSSPFVEFTATGVRVFQGERFGEGEQVELLAATRPEIVGLVLRFRAADPAATIARDLAVAERTRAMFEDAVENADRWLTDPKHPAYPSAQADPETWKAKREEAHATLAAHVEAVEAYKAAGLAPAPEIDPGQPSLF
jgi:hypothetical protein